MHGPSVAVRQVCETYLANGKDVFWAFMDLEKAIDTIDRHGMWQMLRVYGVGGKLLKAVKSFYVGRACVRVGNDVSEWFPVNVGFQEQVQCLFGLVALSFFVFNYFSFLFFSSIGW